MSFSQGARRLAGLAGQALGWRPGEFWAATPDELEAALGVGGEAGESANRGELEALMALFPDRRDEADGR